MHKYNGRNGNGYQPIVEDKTRQPKPPKRLFRRDETDAAWDSAEHNARRAERNAAMSQEESANLLDENEQMRHRAAYAETLLAELAAKEEVYRYVHDCKGDNASLVVGRAWDAMRKAGNKARDFLRRKEHEAGNA